LKRGVEKRSVEKSRSRSAGTGVWVRCGEGVGNKER
jgi:hypothetical protein